jgi:hypothetical protein
MLWFILVLFGSMCATALGQLEIDPCERVTKLQYDVFTAEDAAELAAAALCTNIQLTATWHADIVLEETITVVIGTTLTIEAAPEPDTAAAIDSAVQLFK